MSTITQHIKAIVSILFTSPMIVRLISLNPVSQAYRYTPSEGAICDAYTYTLQMQHSIVGFCNMYIYTLIPHFSSKHFVFAV
jgi:hypothetical protein